MTSEARHGPARMLPVLMLILAVAALSRSSPAVAADGENEFSRTSVDVGLVVDDKEKVGKFYTEAIGFREAEGFSMPGALARKIGLTKGTPLNVRVLVLGEEKTATRLKLIPLPQEETADRTDHVANSQQGFRYITVFVADMDRALKRLKKAGVNLPANGPVQLGNGSPREVFVLLVRDPEGNLVELVGPRKNNEAH